VSAKFEFTAENQLEFAKILKRYPVKRAALLPVLHLAQEQNGYISEEVEVFVSELLEIPLVDVREVLSFYSLFQDRPLGRHHIRVCSSITCWLMGSEGISEHLCSKLGTESGSVSEDGNLSWEVVPDCMGACENAPMFQLDKDYHGELTPEKVDEILAKLD
jgi:NADH-quinone oxidoreductase subunit E